MPDSDLWLAASQTHATARRHGWSGALCTEIDAEPPYRRRGYNGRIETPAELLEGIALERLGRDDYRVFEGCAVQRVLSQAPVVLVSTDAS